MYLGTHANCKGGKQRLSTKAHDVSVTAHTLGDLGSLVKERRAQERLSLRDAADQIGISFNTLARIEGGHIPDLEIFRRVIGWLGLPIASFFSDAETRSATTPEVIAQHLRADTALPTEAATRIAAIVQDLYAALAQPTRTTALHLRASRTFKPAAAQALADILRDIDASLAGEST